MKRILLIAFFLLTVAVCRAQFSMGVKGGMNVSDVAIAHLTPAIVDGYHPRTGYHAGVYAQLQVAPRIQFLAELQFSRRGANTQSSGRQRQSGLPLYYIELPVLFSYSPQPQFSVLLGPALGYNTDLLFMRNRLDLGISGGLQFSITEKIQFFNRYTYGITAMDEHEVRDMNNMLITTLQFYNRNAQIGVSYKLI